MFCVTQIFAISTIQEAWLAVSQYVTTRKCSFLGNVDTRMFDKQFLENWRVGLPPGS